MPAEPDQPVTELLRAAQAGDADAAERLLAVVYEQLRQLARARMARVPPGQTLQPTATRALFTRRPPWSQCTADNTVNCAPAASPVRGLLRGVAGPCSGGRWRRGGSAREV